jgi:hypothetical protein
MAANGYDNSGDNCSSNAEEEKERVFKWQRKKTNPR